MTTTVLMIHDKVRFTVLKFFKGGAWTVQLSSSHYYYLTLVHAVCTDQFSNKLTTTNSTNMCINKTLRLLQT